jgi:hypothetical protein
VILRLTELRGRESQVPAPYFVCAPIVEGSSGSKLHSAPRDRFRDVEFHGAEYSEH